MADTFFFRRNGLFYDVINERTREVVEELIDCVAEARNYVEEWNAKALEAEQAEAAALAEQHADHMASQREMDRIYIEISRKYDADLPATEPRNFAVRQILDAIDSLGRPIAENERRAA